MAEDTVDAVSRNSATTRSCTTKTEPLPGSEEDDVSRSASGWPRRRRTSRRRSSICECEMVPRSKLEQAIAAPRDHEPRRHPPPAAARDGPVPGRVLHLPRHRDPARARRARPPSRPTGRCSHFLQERWKGAWPILYGDQLRQARLDDWIFQGVLDVEHLPAVSEETWRRERRAALRRGRDRRRHRGPRRGRAAGRGRRARVRAGQGHRLDAPRAGDDRRARLRARAGRRRRRPRSRSSPRAQPDHPYALLGVDAVAEALRWFAERVAGGPLPGLRLRRRPRAQLPAADRGRRAPPVGAGARDDGRRRRVVGARPCVRGRHARRCATSTPPLCAANLGRPASARGRSRLEIEVDRADQNALGLARRFDDPALARGVRRAGWRSKLQADERVGLPAMLGIRDPHGAWSDLEHRLGRPVFEIPTLPPSVPGMRLYEILRSALRARRRAARARRRGRVAERDGSRVTSVATRVGRSRRPLRGALVRARRRRLRLGRDRARLALGHARARARPAAARRARRRASRGSSATTWPSSRWRGSGSRSTAELRAEGAENVLVAGAALPGAVPWREGSGEGIALASGSRAAQMVLARAGAPAGAAA